MKGLNRIQILGNLGRDPEAKKVGDSTVVNFSVAINESYKDKQGNKVEKTEWCNVVVWGKLAEIAEKYLKKGSSVLVEGKIQTRSWEKDGEKRYSTEINANNFIMLGGNDKQPSNEDPGDLPF